MTTADEGVRVARVLPFLALIVLQVYTLVDLLRSPADQVRVLPKAVWLLVWVVPVLGPVLWLVFGRPWSTSGPGQEGGGGRGIRPRQPHGPLAPDDDAEFLKQIDEAAWAARMEQLRRERAAGADGRGQEPPAPRQPDAGDPADGSAAAG